MTRAILAALVFALVLTGCTVTVGVDEDAMAEYEATQRALLRSVLVVVDDCGGYDYSRPAHGVMTNFGRVPVNVLVEVDFLDRNLTIVHQSNDRITNLGPGESARWEAHNFERTMADCRARISSVLPS